MGIFQRKKTKEADFDPLQETLECLHHVLENSSVHGHEVWMPGEQLVICPGVSQVREGFASLFFQVKHPSFEEPFFDMSASVGKDVSEAIKKAVASFLCSALCCVRHLVAGEYKRELVSSFCGARQRWDVSESCIVSLNLGETPGHLPREGYWELIADKLQDHLGNRKHYWIKVYASKQQDENVVCECRVNNVVSEELTREITAFAAEWEVSDVLESDKQFFVFTKRESDLAPYPYTRDEIYDFTDRAVTLFGAADTEEKKDCLSEEIEKMTGDSSLGAELYCFLPEICAQNAFPEASYGERLTIQQGERKQELYLDQLASYRFIQQRVLEGFSQGIYDQEVYQKLVYSSATVNALSNALNNGSKLEDIYMASLCYMLPNDYTVR